MSARPDPPMRTPRRLPGVPAIAYTLPQKLYSKALNQQNQLTDAERQLLLSRGDLIGKTLAQPTSLTESERYKVMDRPPPDVVRARIELASNGELSTVAELVAKATLDASGLNDAELHLMGNNFHYETVEVRVDLCILFSGSTQVLAKIQIKGHMKCRTSLCLCEICSSILQITKVQLLVSPEDLIPTPMHTLLTIRK